MNTEPPAARSQVVNQTRRPGYRKRYPAFTNENWTKLVLDWLLNLRNHLRWNILLRFVRY